MKGEDAFNFEMRRLEVEHIQLCWLARQALDFRSLCKAKNFGYFSAYFMGNVLKCIQIHVKLYKFYR